MRRRTRIVLSLTVALPLLLTGPAAAPATELEAQATRSYAGTWKGMTAQDRLIKFRVNDRNRVKRIVVAYRARGAGCTVTGRTTLTDLRARIDSSDEFTVRRQIGNTKVVVKGTMLTRRRAEGIARVVITDTTGFGCDAAARTTWRARRL